VTLIRYVAAGKFDGTPTISVVFVNEYTVREVPPTATVGATPVGLKFEPAREMVLLVKLTVASAITGVWAWLMKGAERINNRVRNRPADVGLNL